MQHPQLASLQLSSPGRKRVPSPANFSLTMECFQKGIRANRGRIAWGRGAKGALFCCFCLKTIEIKPILIVDNSNTEDYNDIVVSNVRQWRYLCGRC
jgi:hypothetical protein